MAWRETTRGEMKDEVRVTWNEALALPTKSRFEIPSSASIGKSIGIDDNLCYTDIRSGYGLRKTMERVVNKDICERDLDRYERLLKIIVVNA